MRSGIQILNVTPENLAEAGIYCIKDQKLPGVGKKMAWFQQQFEQGLALKIACDDKGKQLGFIEYLPAEAAWRPVKANNYLFVQCLALFVKDAKGKEIASQMLALCEADARIQNKSGVCAMSSDGTWMPNQSIYRKNDFQQVDQLGRFELMSKPLNSTAETPTLIDWTQQQERYQGWNLVVSHQCPFHDKAISALQESAHENGISINVHELTTPGEAQYGPSGFGTFSLIRDGQLLADHYISKRRFENILAKELKLK